MSFSTPGRWMDNASTERGRPARIAPGAAPRAAAARALRQVRADGQSLTRVLERLPADLTPAERALVHELVHGSLRLLPRLEALEQALGVLVP